MASVFEIGHLLNEIFLSGIDLGALSCGETVETVDDHLSIFRLIHGLRHVASGELWTGVPCRGNLEG